MENDDNLLDNIEKIHTTEFGSIRLKQNLELETKDIVNWCKGKIKKSNNIFKKGKNWYVSFENCILTINANNYCIITGHKIKRKTGMGKSVNDLKFRHAGNDDFLWLKRHDKHISENILKNKIDSKEIYIVENKKNIIGWLRYNLFWDNIPFMNMVGILKEYRKLGIGAKLVKYWENKMNENGYKNVLTSRQSNEEAQHFYRKLGYNEIGGFKYFNDPYEIIFQKIF